MNEMKKLQLWVLFFLAFATLAFASEESFEGAELLIQQKIACSEITDNQLELIGDYYMEQMHPDRQHEIMDKVMGGEGSAQLRQVHINIARRFYCGDRAAMSVGMMNMMMGRGMMGYGGVQNQGGLRGMMSYGYGMMGGYGFWNVFTLLYVILIIGLIVLVYLWIIKLWKSQRRKR